MRRAVIYCRISRDPDHTELGVQRQEKDCRAICAREGFEVVDVFVDDDRSAYSGRRRPGYEAALTAIRSGAVSVLVAWHPDRITRSPRELESLIDDLEASKVNVLTVQSGEYDLSSYSGRMTARIIGAVARGESEHKSARLRRKHAELAERGMKPGGGKRRYGFEADGLTICEPEAARIREATALVLAGATIRSIVTRWNDEGVTTAGGKAWHPSHLAQMLQSPRFAGLRVHSSGTFPAVWDAIISVDDHRRLVAILTDPERRKNRGGRRYLLTGLLRCSLCEARLVARPRSDKRRCYVCASGAGFHGCGKIRILADDLEADVIEAALVRLDAPGLIEAIYEQPQVDDATALAELQAVDDRLAELAEMWAAGELDRLSWTAARKPLEAAQVALAGRLSGNVRQRSVGATLAGKGGIRDAWSTLTIDDQRAVLAAVIESGTIAPAVRGRNFYDPNRLALTWRA